MSTFVWVMVAVGLFIWGQLLLMRPDRHEKALMHLRDAARKQNLQPRLVAAPEWLVPRSGMVACYSVILPQARLPYWRAQPNAQGQWQTVAGGLDLLQGITLPAELSMALALEGQANSVSLYWREQAGPEVLPIFKQLLLQLGENKEKIA